MGIVLGILSILSLCFLLIKGITGKIHWQKADAFLTKAHKYIYIIFLVFCFFHILFVVPVLKTRNVAVFVTGVAVVTTSLIIIVTCNKMRKEKKITLYWHRILSIFILICAIGHMGVYYIDFYSYQRKIENINLNAIDTNSLEDGKYIGEYDVGYIYAKVSVIISQGIIKRIDIIEHRNEKGSKAEKVIENIINTQDFPVDAISGATNSSNVIQGAIKNALNNGATNK